MAFSFSNIFTVAFIGILIYQFLLSAFQYSLNKRKEYLYYTGYLLMLVINFIVNFYFWIYNTGTSFSYLVIRQIWGLPINFFIQIIYLYFLLEYLHISNTDLIFKRQVRKQIQINLVLGIGLTLYCFYNPTWGYGLNALVIILSFVLYSFLYLLLIKTKLANYKFIVRGTIFLILGFVINVALTIFQFTLFYNDITIMVGVLIEIGFFNYGLQYKMKNQETALLLAEIEKQKAIESEYRRVSADLHDEVGSTLSSIQIMSVISKRKMEFDLPESKKLLQIIGIQALKMQHGLSEIVWGLRTDLNSLDDLTIKMEEILKYTLDPAEIAHEIDIDSEINNLKLSVLQRRNILLILKEAINNILKYADAKKVSIRFNKENDFLNMQIIDAGRGFDYTTTPGNGLKNMENRTIQIKGVFTISSEINKGTSICCKIPVEQLN